MIEQWQERAGLDSSPRTVLYDSAALEKVVTQLSIQKGLLEQALETEREKCPTQPARSRR